MFYNRSWAWVLLWPKDWESKEYCYRYVWFRLACFFFFSRGLGWQRILARLNCSIKLVCWMICSWSNISVLRKSRAMALSSTMLNSLLCKSWMMRRSPVYNWTLFCFAKSIAFCNYTIISSQTLSNACTFDWERYYRSALIFGMW